MTGLVRLSVCQLVNSVSDDRILMIFCGSVDMA